MVVVAAAQDAVPALVQISGDLVDQKGKPLTGPQGVTFALYKEQSGDAPLWVETQTVTADAQGHFVALLGATSPSGLPLDLFSTNQARWLGMQAVGQPEHPRTFLASVPYALAQLSAPLTGTQGIESHASITPSAEPEQNASTTTTAAAPLSSGPPAVPIFSIVTDATSGLQSANNGAGTVTLSLVKSCAAGQLLKWNRTAWDCTADTDVKIGVTGGGLNVLANGTSPNIVGGFSGNTVTTGAAGATIAGGGSSGIPNSVTGSFGSIGGGHGNSADIAGTVAGGTLNRAFQSAAVGGGISNVASGELATVPGGFRNTAGGANSFAAGFYADARDGGAFVWADPSYNPVTFEPIPFHSTGPSQFLIRASGGVGIGTNVVDPAVAALTVAGRVKSDGLCLGTDCRSAWPSGDSGITGVTAGVGLIGGGTTGNVSLGVDFGVAQRRITGSCGSGFAVRAVDEQGFVECAAVVNAGVTGTGGVNFLPKFIGSNAVGNSMVFDDGSTVGIGTISPLARLGVTGGSDRDGGFFQTAKRGGIALRGDSFGDDFSAGLLGIGWGLNGMGVSGLGSVGIRGISDDPAGVGGKFENFYPGGKALVAFGTSSEALTVLNSGKVGIQNETPAEALDVNGNVKASKFIGDGSMLTNLPSGGGGTITSVTPLQGLTGGGTTGNVSLGIADHGVTNLMLQK